ncbi:hypothetical protein [Novosphingobium naphthalenivorans]|uniref:hypothetical protein n=1 Tax=Novosphingobium naphthalenivorans TaxID=273168 RepID=UPI00083588B7|nr:hypothetical protein [Novosphingobium naphthalenivorans]
MASIHQARSDGTTSDVGIRNVGARIEEYAAHLSEVARVFNDHAMALGLGVTLDADRAVQAIKSGANISRVARFCDREDDSGVLHDSQLMTALECVGEILTAPQKNGLVLGAMQSGKTTTSLALQLAGPIVYMLTERCLYPIYLITSQTSQEDQTRIEIARFLDYYGELAVVVDEQNRCKLIDYVKRNGIDPFFSFSPTINTYREHVLKGALPDTMMGPKLDDFIKRRVPGDAIRQVAKLCRDANSKGFSPLLIIDEPQFGASDRFVKVEDGVERRPCVLLRIFDAIDEALGDDASDRVFIGLSATPYELEGINGVWKVRQYLTSSYLGFNYFGGKVIDSEANVEPPRTMSFDELADELDIPFLKDVSLQAYEALPHVFSRYADKIGFADNQEHYRRKVEETLRAAILTLARKRVDIPTGICIRLCNNNLRSHRLIENLDLPEDEIEVVEYFGNEYKGMSVKRALKKRDRPDLPFLIAVTSRARMGDAFPNSVEWFLEFSRKAANLNALLQGSLGRACGYGKSSTVVLSADNAQLVDDYKREQGDYFYKTSPHSVIVGPYRRGAPTTLIRLRRDMPDPLVAKFFDRLDAEVVEPYLMQGNPTLRAKRGSAGSARMGPILRIAEEIGLFDHIEDVATRERLFPTYPEIQIARAGDAVPNSRDPNELLTYAMDESGNCRFTFREWSGDGSNHGGVRSRGYGSRDAMNRDDAGNKLEPQINMRKFDPNTGEAIDDKRMAGRNVPSSDRRPGNWRAEMITLPLVAPVRELQSGRTTHPVPHSPYYKYLSPEEIEDAAA